MELKTANYSTIGFGIKNIYFEDIVLNNCKIIEIV